MNTWTVETLRAFEQEVRAQYLTGRIRAPVHLSRGNEKQLIEIFQDVRPQDWVFSTYRSHYHALLKGIPREEVMAEILAGHSIHLEFPEHRFFTSAIVGGTIPIALGTALGIKRWGGSEKVWLFCGDMASHTGTFHEAAKYAQNFNLPITFVCECNNMSTNSPTHELWGIQHTHITYGSVLNRQSFDSWDAGGIINYCYDREFPHYGVGFRVDFDQTDQAPAEERSDVMV
jgi:pyruvate dehydrogenase E1 component alpha subunit